MRINRAGNFMLVINTLLLTVLVLGHFGTSPFEARAVGASTPPPMLMNAASQRQRMIVALDEMNKNAEASTAAIQALKSELQKSVELQRQLVRLLERSSAAAEP